MRNHLTFLLPAALILILCPAKLHAQDAVDGLLRRGPGPRGQQSQQSGLPPTQPTAIPTPAPAPTQPSAPAAPKNLNERPSTRARVLFANGLLEVRADNSSLLQILHDISRIAGMSITGGVNDQHIFGDYGPASPSTVLAALLDGSGANMLLRQNTLTGAPTELVLTQRSGGSAPSPNGPGFDDSPFPPETPSVAAPVKPAPAKESVTKPAPLDPNAPHPTNYVPGSPFNPQEPTPPQNTVNSASAPATPAPQPLGANATPEAIYQQLLQMQKSKAAAAPSATAPTTTPK